MLLKQKIDIKRRVLNFEVRLCINVNILSSNPIKTQNSKLNKNLGKYNAQRYSTVYCLKICGSTLYKRKYSQFESRQNTEKIVSHVENEKKCSLITISESIVTIS